MILIDQQVKLGQANRRKVGDVETIGGERFVTAAEAAELLGVKIETLYAYTSRGRVRAYRRGAGRRRLYRLTELEGMLALQPAGRRTRLPRAEDWVPYT